VDSNHDKVFVTTFLGVIGFLVALTVVIAVIAGVITSEEDTDEIRQITRERVEARIAPVGQVITDPNAIKVASSASEESARSAEEIVQGLCSGCHAAGVAGAPKLDDTAAWQARLDAEGRDGLVGSVVNGKGAMPPMAGDPSLSEAQIEEAVDLMLEQAGV
jgi:cytochrome c5